MKNIKKLVIALLIAVSPIIVKAATGLTITDKSYNKNTYEFVVSGTSNYDEVMVSLFDGEELLSFKTVSTNNNEYTATFEITFEQDKTVTIKVGDINSQDYEIASLDVEKSEIIINNTLTDEDGNQLIIKGANAEFRENEILNINMYSMEDINEMLEAVKGTEQEEEFTQGYNLIKLALGNKEMLSYIEVNVEDGAGHSADYSSHMGGFTLKLKVEKEMYESLGDFEIAQLDEETGKLGNSLTYTYDEENEMLVMNIDKLGRLLAYAKPEESTNTTSPKTGDSIMKSIAILGISVVGLVGAAIVLKKKIA